MYRALSWNASRLPSGVQYWLMWVFYSSNQTWVLGICCKHLSVHLHIYHLFCFSSPKTEKSRRPVTLESRGSMGEELDSLRSTIDDEHSYESNSTDTHSKAPRRRKRFLSYPRYVELMVTADAKMVRHHGRNLEHYILTIMSVVSKTMFLKIIIFVSVLRISFGYVQYCEVITKTPVICFSHYWYSAIMVLVLHSGYCNSKFTGLSSNVALFVLSLWLSKLVNVIKCQLQSGAS